MKLSYCFIVILIFLGLSASAQQTHEEGTLTIGGYGEVALSRNFYSDNVYRYSSASSHKGEQHGRFDIPHSVVYVGYDFGKGWTMQTEIEFEHTGTGVSVEKEFEEAGEWCKKQVFDQQFSEKLISADFGKLVLHIVIDKAVMRQRAAASLLGA